MQRGLASRRELPSLFPRLESAGSIDCKGQSHQIPAPASLLRRKTGREEWERVKQCSVSSNQCSVIREQSSVFGYRYIFKNCGDCFIQLMGLKRGWLVAR